MALIPRFHPGWAPSLHQNAPGVPSFRGINFPSGPNAAPTTNINRSAYQSSLTFANAPEFQSNKIDHPDINIHTRFAHIADLRRRAPYTVLPGELCFLNTTTTTLVTNGGGLVPRDAQKHWLGLGALNAYFFSEKGRVKYGADTGAAAILRDWPFHGQQTTDPEQTMSQNVVSENMAFLMRARLANIWLADSVTKRDKVRNVPRRGDSVWLVLIRCHVDDADPLQIAKAVRQFHTRTEEKPKYDARGVPLTYWKYVPRFYRCGGPADIEFNSYDRDDRWAGARKKIGILTDILSGEGAIGMADTAKRYLYSPEGEERARAEAYCALPHGEVFLQI